MDVAHVESICTVMESILRLFNMSMFSGGLVVRKKADHHAKRKKATAQGLPTTSTRGIEATDPDLREIKALLPV